MPDSEWQVGRYHPRGLAANEDVWLQSSEEDFLLTSPFMKHFTISTIVQISKIMNPFWRTAWGSDGSRRRKAAIRQLTDRCETCPAGLAVPPLNLRFRDQ